MDFDEVLSSVGDFGRYQKWLFVLLCVPAGPPSAVSIFSHIFISAVPKHHCHAPVQAEKASFLDRSLAASEDYHHALSSLFIPRDAKGNFAKCHQYDIDVNSAIDQVVTQNGVVNSTVIEEFVAQYRLSSVRCLNGWDYDTTIYPETLASKLNVVCDQKWLISTAQSAFFCGGTIGCIASGWISDRWGRRAAFSIATALMIFGSLAEINPPSYLAYIAIRFIVGLSYPSVHNLSFLIVAEIIGVKSRRTWAMACGISFSVGMMLFAFVAHFIKHWQALQALISLPMLLLIGFYWLVPESPRWLISQGRIEEAEAIVQRMAKINGVSLPPNFLRTKSVEHSTAIAPGEQGPTGIKASSLLRYREVLRKIIVISIIWTITAVMYNGMSFAAPQLATEAHVAFFLSGLAEIPGILMAWVTMERYGRKTTMFGNLLLGGMFSVTTAFAVEELPWLAVLLTSMAKLCVSSTFTVIIMYAGELFPTVIRGFAIGVASTTSQLGLVVTPYILLLGTIYGSKIPFLLLGALSWTAALLMLTLPETLGAPLPTTMEEAENYRDYVGRRKESEKIQPVIDKPDTYAEHEDRKSSEAGNEK